MMKRYTFILLSIGFSIVALSILYNACRNNLTYISGVSETDTMQKVQNPCSLVTGNSTGTLFFQFDSPDSVQTNCITVNVSAHTDTLREIKIVSHNLDNDTYFSRIKYFPVYRSLAPGDSDRYDVNIITGGIGRVAVYVQVNDCSEFFYSFTFDGVTGRRDDSFLTKQVTQKLIQYGRKN